MSLTNTNPLPDWLEILGLKILFLLYIGLLMALPFLELRWKRKTS